MGRVHPIAVACALIVGGVVYAALDPTQGIGTWHRLAREVGIAETTARAQKARNAELAARIEQLRDDPAAIEAAIREEIGWVRPGELRIELEDRAPATLP